MSVRKGGAWRLISVSTSLYTFASESSRAALILFFDFAVAAPAIARNATPRALHSATVLVRAVEAFGNAAASSDRIVPIMLAKAALPCFWRLGYFTTARRSVDIDFI